MNTQKNIFHGIAMLSLTILFISSCTKYEDGPMFTFRSKTKRISHTWVYDAIIYNSQGTTVTTNLPNLTMTFDADGKYTENTGYAGTYKFSGAVDLEITKSKSGDSTVTQKWEITRLSTKELWLRLSNVDHHFKSK